MDVFPFDLLNKEHQRIYQKADSNHLTIRLLGALAFELHCASHASLRAALGRTFSDLDYMALSKHWEQIIQVMVDLGYEFDERRAMLHGQDRLIFFHPDGLRVDFFFDRLDMCHAIDFRNRLEILPQTISLADLLLEKLQIVRITEKDIIDTLVLFLEYPIGEDEMVINGGYIAGLFANDWGFYTTGVNNLTRLQNEFIHRYELLSQADRQTIRTRISDLLQMIENKPKSMRWKLRSQVGTSVKWYKEIGELNR